MNSVALSLSKNYVAHWSWKEAVRELIQNALDCDDRLIYSPQVGELNIATNGGAISRTSLLLGESGKRDSDKIGHFGEGLKLALLILAREGYEVKVYSGNDLWTPVLRYSDEFQTECLHIDITDNETSLDYDVVINIKGLSYDQIEDVDGIYLTDDMKSLAIVSHGGTSAYKKEDLLLNEYDDPVSKVFVGGLYVCDLPEGFHYSYDFHPSCMELDRDRQTVDDWNVCWEISKFFVAAGRADLLAELAKIRASDVKGYTKSHLSYGGSYSTNPGNNKMTFSDELAKLAADNFREVNGEKGIPVDRSMNRDKLRVLKGAIGAAGYHAIEVSSSEFAMIGDAIKLPDNIKIVKKPDTKGELQSLVDKHKLPPALVKKIKTLIQDITDWEDFTK